MPSTDTQFKPGQSGNPGGRPRGRSIVGTSRELLELTAAEFAKEPPPETLTVREKIARKWIQLGLDGDVKALKDLTAQLDGRPRQAVPEETHSTVRDAALQRLRETHDNPGSQSNPST